MPRTTGEWEELLYTVGDTDVEAVTESAFFSEAEGDIEFHNIQYTGGRVVGGWLNPGQSFRSREWAELVASAPEAVGEVIRLRRLLEAGVSECERADTPNAKTLAKMFTTMLEGN